MSRSAVAILGFVLALTASAAAEPCCDPAGPFRAGEGLAEVPATCVTAPGWRDAAPVEDGRITMSVTGRVDRVADVSGLTVVAACLGDLAPVLCVTYGAEGLAAGDRVLLAGGYRAGPGPAIVLDPCIYWPGEG
ncbi:hypothetical protein HKCCE2091_07830 [Rhodobacterales bacterium HKCCE2091]|nr:hypothetical protein [Rhodobacterales bacterium HKCCE2091]